jgi:hypothetical protein
LRFWERYFMAPIVPYDKCKGKESSHRKKNANFT